MDGKEEEDAGAEEAKGEGDEPNSDCPKVDVAGCDAAEPKLKLP